ncbi:hypothetical protein C2G38_2188629 [Gigaspora rosea]|uniref:Uncharacterized protein n=1 Tax=Gigaspora rosea TaxID=44941 RepID=A0A397V7N6_9GLOM|nr:hypothetical protein C2G38_2188629 [Gigaspora rosea]
MDRRPALQTSPNKDYIQIIIELPAPVSVAPAGKSLTETFAETFAETTQKIVQVAETTQQFADYIVR